MTHKKVGLALSGGAARGPAHVGVLRVLERAEIPIDVVAGVSAGSVAGALYCAGISLDRMNELMAGFTWRHISSLIFPRHGFLSFEKLEKWLIDLLGDIEFGDLARPFAVGTTDLLTGWSVIFSEGRLAPIVRASCSIPGLVVPLEWGQYWLVDGGVSGNLPAQAARSLGADFVIGVDLAKPAVRKILGPLGTASTALEILVRHSGGGLASADIVIAPALGGKTYTRFSKHAEMVKLGEEAATAMLPTIRALLEESAVPLREVEIIGA